jgi:hypothetical protein
MSQARVARDCRERSTPECDLDRCLMGNRELTPAAITLQLVRISDRIADVRSGNAPWRRATYESAVHPLAVEVPAAPGSAPARHGAGLEGPASTACALRAPGGAWQVQAANRHRRRPRVARLHLGHRPRDRGHRQPRSGTRRLSAVATRTMMEIPGTSGQRPWRPTVKENPRHVLCGSPRAEPATLVARQLPTNHDHDGERSRSIHEYQSFQPSRIAATAAAHWCSVIGKRRRRRRRLAATLDGSLHIRTLSKKASVRASVASEAYRQAAG